MNIHVEDLNQVGHGTATAAVVVAILGWLTPVLTALATAASIIWFAICIWESQTVQHWKNNFLMKHHAKKLTKLRATELRTKAKIVAMEVERQGRAAARDVLASAAIDAANIVAVEPLQTAKAKLP